MAVAVALLAVLLPRSKPAAAPRRPRVPAHALLEIDPSTMRTKATIRLGRPLTGLGEFAGHPLPPERSIAIGPEGSVWVTNGDDNTVTRVDPATGATTSIRLPEAPRSLAIGSGAVWVTVQATARAT